MRKMLAGARWFILALSCLPGTSSALTEGDYAYTVSDGKATITYFSASYSGALTITNTLGGYPVVVIGNDAFRNRQGLTAIAIPSSVIGIGEFAFYYCGNLTNVTIPASVTNIGDDAFGASGLTAISIPAGVERIGDNVFGHCFKLASVTLPDGLTSIGALAFTGCDSLATITIPASVTNIGPSALYYCNELTGIFFEGEAPVLGNASVFHDSATVYYLPCATNWGSTFGGLATLCWNPAIKNDSAFGFATNRFGFNIAGTTNIPVVVEVCSNLNSGVWVPLQTNTLGASGSLYFSDALSADHAARFYRIVWP